MTRVFMGIHLLAAGVRALRNSNGCEGQYYAAILRASAVVIAPLVLLLNTGSNIVIDIQGTEFVCVVPADALLPLAE